MALFWSVDVRIVVVIFSMDHGGSKSQANNLVTLLVSQKWLFLDCSLFMRENDPYTFCEKFSRYKNRQEDTSTRQQPQPYHIIA